MPSRVGRRPRWGDRRSCPPMPSSPTPTDGPLTLATDGMAQAVLVYTLGGNPVGGWRIVTLAPGTYLLSVATLAGTRTAKFIRR